MTADIATKLAETVAESRVPTKVEDPTTLARIAQLFLGDNDATAGGDHTREEAKL